jgi:response regulator RpfG family c-di-GMP phosphodiesterase/serine/threonine protein kinase
MKPVTCYDVPMLNGIEHAPAAPPLSVSRVLESWLASSLVLKEDWDQLSCDQCEDVLRAGDHAELRRRLVEHNLLTSYQAGRLEAGSTFGLILGSYRVLDRLGAGGMGIVFLAEHIRMRRRVAIKVLPMHPDQDQRLLTRFLCEIRTIARLQHPNIVWAMDAGECPSTDTGGTVLHYFVMEYVPGQDLEELIRSGGPLPFAKTCDFVHQIASALAEANKHHLVHRDLKPSNIQVTPEGQAKLLDFGLARNYRFQSTEPGTILGTLDYMAPEQIQDAHHVDIRADIYGLGGVMYWCLTGKPPFVLQGGLIQEVGRRLQLPPPSVLASRPDLPLEVDAILARMMAIHPSDRYSAPEQIMKAVLPYIRNEGEELLAPVPLPLAAVSAHGTVVTSPRVQQVLIADDEDGIRMFARMVLQSEGLCCDEAHGGREALEKIKAKPYDLVLLDVNMPDLSGSDVCKSLRENPPYPNLKIIMASGGANADVMAQILLQGADDFITKPFGVMQLQARVKAALRLKQAQDRADILNQHLQSVNQELEKTLGARDHHLVESRNALVLALAKLVDHRVGDTGGRLLRMQRYCRVFAEEAARCPALTGQITPAFVEMLSCCAPLHDIGKIGLPDHILLKPGKLDADERMLMQSHTVIGAETLQEVARKHGSSLAFLQMGVAIARHHHERFDGTGYPDRLQAHAIPLEARLVAIPDVYDALRRRTAYKPSLSHHAATQIILESSPGHFDPMLLPVFQRVHLQFEKIHREMPNN